MNFVKAIIGGIIDAAGWDSEISTKYQVGKNLVSLLV